MSKVTIESEGLRADGSAGLPSFLHYDPYYPRFWEHLKGIIAQGIPVLLRLYPGSNYPMREEELHGVVDREGHVVVMIGYDDITREAIVADPWNKEAYGGARGGYTRIPYDHIKCGWVDCTADVCSMVVPWHLDLTWPAQAPLGEPFELETAITYSCPEPLSTASYHAQACHARLELPANLGLYEDSETKRLGDGFMRPGETKRVSWRLVRTGPVEGTLAVRVRGLVVSNDPYLYSDVIGVRKDVAVKILSHAAVSVK